MQKENILGGGGGGGTHPPCPRLNCPQDEVQKVLQFQQYLMSLGILTLYKKVGNESFQIGCHCFKYGWLENPVKRCVVYHSWQPKT